VTDVDAGLAAGLAAALDEQYGFAVDVPHLSVVGRCRECRAGPRR
jgi:hypothetical protein